jgi:hypothetical protein
MRRQKGKKWKKVAKKLKNSAGCLVLQSYGVKSNSNAKEQCLKISEKSPGCTYAYQT